MKELFRTNDPVAISWVQAVLADAGIGAVVLDGYTSVIEGSIGAIQRRVMVADDDHERARALVAAEGGGHLLPADRPGGKR
jgi:hypothetical protein